MAYLNVVGSSSSNNLKSYINVMDKKEEWKDIVGFEGIYQVSNWGNLKSNKSGKWRILSLKNNKGGYMSVVLLGNNRTRSARMHVLVYESFVGDIPKDKKYQIHHIDGNKMNNNVDNLKLVTVKEHHYLHKDEHSTEGMNFYNKYIRPRKIVQKDKNGKIIAIYDNSTDAHKKTGVCARNILQVANKEPYDSKGNYRKQAGGYVWEFLK